MKKYILKKKNLSAKEVDAYRNFDGVLDARNLQQRRNYWRWILPAGLALFAAWYYYPAPITPVIMSEVSDEVSVKEEATSSQEAVPTNSEKENVPEKKVVPVLNAGRTEQVDEQTKQQKAQTDITPTFVEASPRTGYDELYEYFSRELVYPVEAEKLKITGSVVVAFDIDSAGVVSNAQIASTKEESLNEEALRLIKNMPPWQPALLKGYPIQTRLSIPIHFDLIEEK